MGDFIYHICSEKTKVALEHFCKTFNESNADVYILMAQKALCLYELLISQGLIEPKRILSSIAIDFNNGMTDFSNKKVALVDDIIVSGSALSAASVRLKAFGVTPSNLEIIAIARDTEYQTIKFTDPETKESILKCAMNLSDPECIELSYEISRLLSYYGIPYDTDYPKYDEIELNNSDLKTLQNSPLWSFYDITNEENVKNSVSSFVLYPSDIFKSCFWNKIGVYLEEQVNLKARVYIKKRNNSMSMTIVPKAVFNEFFDKDILLLFDFFKDNIFENEDFGQDWSTKTKFRFLQYLIAYNLMIMISKEISKSALFNLNLVWLETQFGESFQNVLNALKKSTLFFNKSKNTIAFTCEKPKPDLFSNKIIEPTDIEKKELNELLLEPFKMRHETIEIPTRLDISKDAKHFIEDAKIIDKYSKRIREGFSFVALTNIFDNLKYKFDIEKLLSNFIERGIDLGIIVPIVYHYKCENYEYNNYICRAYRHGEDLPFGEADRYRFVFFLKCLYDQFKQFRIQVFPATITFEKILVLFIQMGLRKGNIFNRFLGFDNYPVLKERFCVHGAIAAFYEKEKVSHIYTEKEDSIWITKWLSINNLIEKDESTSRDHYIINKNNVDAYLRENNSGNLSEDIGDSIETIANIIVSWYSLYQHKKDIFKNQITTITSCRDQYTFASAIATELHYFKRYWNENVTPHINNFFSDDTFLEGLFKYKTTEQALKSGRDKHEWYESKKAKEIILQVSEQLKELRNNTYIPWKLMNKNENDAKDYKLTEIINEAIGYLYFYSVCYEWLSNDCLFKLKSDVDSIMQSKTILDNIAKFEELTTTTSSLNIELFSLFSEVTKISNPYQRVIDFTNKMNRIIIYCDSLIQKIEDTIVDKVETYTMHYKSCFVVEINTTNQNNTDELFLSLWNLLDEDENKTNLNIIRFDSNDNKHQKYGVFYTEHLTKGNIAESYLFNVYKKIHLLINKAAYPTKTIYVPCIPNQVVMRHNTKSHISQYSNSFYNDFIKHLMPFFNSEALDQTLLIKTKHCSEQTTETFRKLYEFETNINNITQINIPELLSANLYYINDKRKLYNRYDYSTGAIINGNTSKVCGTGFLFFHNNKEYCVTCQHIIEEIPDEQIYFKLKDSTILIKILPIARCSEISDFDQKDVAILELKESFKKYVDSSKNFSKDYCISEKDINVKEDTFNVFGYSKDNGEHVYDLFFEGTLDNGFYSLNSGRSNKKLDYGFSGAGVISNQGYLLGMHTSHDFDNTIEIIPSKVIINQIDLLNQNN